MENTPINRNIEFAPLIHDMEITPLIHDIRELVSTQVIMTFCVIVSKGCTFAHNHMHMVTKIRYTITLKLD